MTSPSRALSTKEALSIHTCLGYSDGRSSFGNVCVQEAGVFVGVHVFDVEGVSSTLDALFILEEHIFKWI